MKAHKLGIWMDHMNAHLIEFSNSKETKTIHSKFTHEAKENSLDRGENKMHSKERHQQAEYHKSLGEIIKNYKEVLLFGPTDAKVELKNLLEKEHAFAAIKIVTEPADKMTENQQHAFVTDYFHKHPTPLVL